MTRPPVSVRLAAVALIALMAIGSVAMWLGAPLFWIWLASRLSDTTQPQLSSYLIVIAGVPTTMVILGKGLSRLNRLYGDLMGADSAGRVQTPWLRSMRGERAPTRPRSVLDVVMVWSVAMAVLAMGVWFFFIAGSSLPK
ncbi:MAG: hypothetical protein QOI98_2562 [Solirubrobacteraceae bacterium]|jgi:hypothetical protein|nr:hypothetical protein [Solirubrobacteraceae bacterium]